MSTPSTMSSVTSASEKYSTDPSDRASPSPEPDSDHIIQDNEGEEDDRDKNKGKEPDEIAPESDKWLENPSKDIPGDLTRLLGGGFEFRGSFYSSNSFPQAPNPCLNIDGLGPVGLPLTEAAAKRVIGSSNQAPFGKGETTVVDTNVRDTWEIDAAKVHFNNPTWVTWMNDTVMKKVCESLGVSLAKGRPRLELYKLLVYEKGSHFLPHKDTEKTPGMFATVIVILPSPFEGGNIHLSHAGKTKIIDTSLTSTFSTHVASWYTDVTHSVKPIKSGYRLALSYNLVHTFAPSLQPRLTGWSPQMRDLKHSLLSWKWRESPTLLVYLLDHNYSESNLMSTAIKGKDAHMVKHLRSVAEPLGFELYLANIELYQSGGKDDEELKIPHPQEETWTIKNAVDLDGTPFDLDNLSINNKRCIPKKITDCAPDDVEGDTQYYGNESGEVELWYRQTGVIVIRPKEDVKSVKSIFEYSKVHLEPSSSTTPDKDERSIVDGLVRFVSKVATGTKTTERKEAIQILRKTAVRWKNVDLWLRTCRVARLDIHIDMMGVNNLPEDVATFGFSNLRDFLDLFVNNGLTDKMRFDLVAAIRQLGEQNNDQSLVQWATTRNKRIISSLRTLDVPIIPVLLKELEEEGPSLLETTLIPQFNKLSPTNEFWISLITHLHSAKQRMPQHEAKLSHHATTFLQDCCYNKESMFPGIVPQKPKNTWQSPYRTHNIQRWISLVKLCFSTDNGAIVKGQLTKMKEEIKGMLSDERMWVGEDFFPAAMNALNEYVTESKPKASLKEYVSDFFQMALQIHLEETLLKKGYKYDLKLVPLALRWSGHQCLEGRLVSEIPNFAPKRWEDLRKLALSIIEYRKTLKLEDESERAALQKMVAHIAILAVKNDPMTPENTYGRPSKLTERQVLPLTDLLISAGCEKDLDMVLQRILPAMRDNAGETNRAYMEECLLPVIAGLAKQFKKASMEWPHPTASEFSSKILTTYVRDALGRKSSQVFPPKEVLSFKCGQNCPHCVPLRSFYQDSSLSLDVEVNNSDIKYHLIKEIDRIDFLFYNSGIRFAYDLVRTGSTYKLQVKKPAKYVSDYDWTAKRQYAAEKVAILGPPEAQQEVLGSEWPDIHSILEGQAETTAGLPAVEWEAPLPSTNGIAATNAGEENGMEMDPQLGPSHKRKRSVNGEMDASTTPKKTKHDIVAENTSTSEQATTSVNEEEN